MYWNNHAFDVVFQQSRISNFKNKTYKQGKYKSGLEAAEHQNKTSTIRRTMYILRL